MTKFGQASVEVHTNNRRQAMTPADYLTVVLLVAGGVFFLAGTIGLLRFPDVYTRLHALTKADNVGLGLIVAGLAIQASSWAAVVKLLLIWLPFGKLMHMFLVFVSRGTTGAAFTRKGASL